MASRLNGVIAGMGVRESRGAGQRERAGVGEQEGKETQEGTQPKWQEKEAGGREGSQ